MKEQLLKLEQVFAKAKGERIELKDIKTLDKLSGQLKSVVDKLDDSKIKSELTNYDKVNEDVKKQGGILDIAEDSITISKQKVEKAKKELEADNKAYLKYEKEYNTAKKKQEAAAKKVFSANDKYLANYKKAESIADKLEDAVIDVKEAAKKLGVKVPVDTYTNLVVKFKNLQENPLEKLDFDY